jgi:hypothetical protein
MNCAAPARTRRRGGGHNPHRPTIREVRDMSILGVIQRTVRYGLKPPEPFVFALPPLLVSLVERGEWPADDYAALRQHVVPRVTPGCVKAFAPEENRLFLYAAPWFDSIGAGVRANKGLTPEQEAIADIDPERTLVIADFGLGSDTAVALDYRGEPAPTVIRLQWRLPDAPNRWVPVAPTFDAFWAMLRFNDGR